MRLGGRGLVVESSGHRREIVTKSRYLAEQTKLFKVDHGTIDPIDSQCEQDVAEKIMAASRDAAAVVFADFGFGLITESLLDRIMPALRSAVPIITADVSGRQGSLLRFKSVDLLCPTEREVREALSGNICRCSGYQAIIDAVLIAARQAGGAHANAQVR